MAEAAEDDEKRWYEREQDEETKKEACRYQHGELRRKRTP